jgi:uncharacterized protein (TIRG00374 family)
MPKILIRIFSYLFPIGLSALLLYFAFQKIPLNELLAPFQKADYRWIVLSAVLGAISHWARAARWQLAIHPLGYQVHSIPAFYAVMVGYFMNFIIPRAGEFVRCGMIQKLEGVPADKAFGTVVTERIIDVLMLGILFLILILVELNRLAALFMEFFQSKMGHLFSLFYILLIISILAILTLYLIWRYKAKIQQLPFFDRLQKIALNIWQGIISIKKVKNPILFIAYTLLIWLMYYLMAYVLFFCFPETQNLDLWFGFIILIMGTIGMATPVQGGFGAYHLLVGNVFALRNLSVEQGIILATFMHTVQMLIVLGLGGICFVLSWFWRKPLNSQRGQN